MEHQKTQTRQRLQNALAWAIAAALALTAAFAMLGCSCAGANPTGEGDAEGEAEKIVNEIYEEAGVPKPEDYEFKGEVLEEEKASDSEDSFTEKKVAAEVAARGFEGLVLESSYSMSGDYTMDSELTDPAARHPMYYGFYEAPNGSVWLLAIVDGEIMASPFDNITETSVQTVLCEVGHVCIYDGYADRFIRGIPDGTEMSIVEVERVDADTLARYSEEATSD